MMHITSSSACLLALSLFTTAVRGVGFENMTMDEIHRYNAGRTLSVGFLVFDGFTPLDVFGPIDFLQRMSNKDYNMTLTTISHHAGIVTSKNPNSPNGIGFPVVATHSVVNAPPINLLLVPGGILPNGTWAADFIAAQYDSVDIVASVCTGAKLLANAGILNGKRATTNKNAWKSIVTSGTNVTWVPTARYVHDGKVWTSSGVQAGMDLAYALLRWMYGEEKVNMHFNQAEYAPHVDPSWDPYSRVFNVPGETYEGSTKELVGPLGYE